MQRLHGLELTPELVVEIGSLSGRMINVKTEKPRMILIYLVGVVCLFPACAAPLTTVPPPEPTAIPATALPVTSPTHLPTIFTPVLPTVTPTPEPPTATPMEVFTLATSAEEIVGTWYESGSYIRFDEDGTFRQAFSLDKLDNQPYAISSYRFEGTKMVTSEISVSGVPSCGNKIGSYEIRMLENGNIEIVTIQDQCRPRAGDTSGEKEPIESPSPRGSVYLQNGLVALLSVRWGCQRRQRERAPMERLKARPLQWIELERLGRHIPSTARTTSSRS